VKHAMNIAGGLHHAHPNRASGFCIFNDPAVSIAYLKKRYGVEKVLYLDIDAHHGDGVMYGFYSDSGVLDIDFHEDGRHLFPGTGFTEETGRNGGLGFKINVPLLPFVDDDAYLKLFRDIVPLAVRKFRPQVLLLQCGADSHANDLLAHLQITTKTYREVVRTLLDLANEVADSRLVVFGGGGYNVANVARAWTIVASTIAGHVLPDSTPQHWRKLFEVLVGEKAPEKIDSEGEAGSELSPEVTQRHVAQVLGDLKRRVPLLA
jgi:acetoin utilization protein AcuC